MKQLTNDYIRENVILLMIKIKHLDKQYIIENINEPITGRKINFNEIDLTYLFLEIVSFFNVKFTKNDVENYKFNSIEQIVNTIQTKFDCKSDIDS